MLTSPFRSFRPFTARLAAITLLGSAASSAVAIDLSNNLDNVTSGIESASGTRWLGASFGTDAAAHTLNSVTLLLANTIAGSAEVSVYSNGGLEPAPGGLVGTLVSPGAYSATLAETTFTTSGIALSANTTYWIVLRPISGQFDWAWTGDNSGSGAGFQGTWALSNDGGEFWWSQDIYPTKFGVTVDACPCAADFNCSGAATPQDIFDFLTAFFTPGSLDADFNHNGQVTAQDIFDFLAAFFTPCP